MHLIGCPGSLIDDAEGCGEIPLPSTLIPSEVFEDAFGMSEDESCTDRDDPDLTSLLVLSLFSCVFLGDDGGMSLAVSLS